MSYDSPERATLALVSEQIKGLQLLTHAGFESVQRQLDAVATVPVEVASLRGQVAGLEKRVDELEATEDRAAEWKRGSLPMIGIGTLTTIISIVLLIANFHH